MIVIKVFIISLIQGITEFLPVSSSGHIAILKKLFGLEFNIFFDVVVHLGTLFAVLLFYRVEILQLVTGLFRSESKTLFSDKTLSRNEIFYLWGLFLVAILPAGFAGLFLSDYIDFLPSEAPAWYYFLIGTCFMVTALLLFFSSKIKRVKKFRIYQSSFFNSLLVGVSQAFAILPGISRSGATISSAVIIGYEREDAARFSFLMSIPLIFAAFLLELKKVFDSELVFHYNNIILFIFAFFVSFVVGYFSLLFLIKLLSKGKIWIFSIYLILPAFLSFFIGYSGS